MIQITLDVLSQSKLPQGITSLKIDDRKIVEYLLNENHPSGAGKAKFFISKGYRKQKYDAFIIMLVNHLIQNLEVEIETNGYGTKYIFMGDANGAGKFKSNVFKMKSVWFVENGKDFLNLVTAYPIRL